MGNFGLFDPTTTYYPSGFVGHDEPKENERGELRIWAQASLESPLKYFGNQRVDCMLGLRAIRFSLCANHRCCSRAFQWRHLSPLLI